MSPIKLTLKTLDKNTYIEYIEDDSTILDLKTQIQNNHNFLIDNIKLLYLGKTLEDNILINSLTNSESAPNLFVASAIISSAPPKNPESKSICWANTWSETPSGNSDIAFSVSLILAI